MSGTTRAGWRKLLARVAPRDREELVLLLGGVVFLFLVVIFVRLAGEVLEGETLEFDKRLLLALRDPTNPSQPIGPAWLASGALDITALGSATVLGLVVFAVTGFLVLQGMWRMGTFVFLACSGAWFINGLLKQFFVRPRPDVVPHLREVFTMSFPSGHALTSAVVYLTLGALLMRVAKSRLTKLYCMGIAMLATSSRMLSNKAGASARPAVTRASRALTRSVVRPPKE